MPTATITADDIIRSYADDIAYVAETNPATDIATLADQTGKAAKNLSLAGINGHENVETAAGHLHEASIAVDDTARTMFLKRADKLLRNVDDMTAEYREMVAD